MLVRALSHILSAPACSARPPLLDLLVVVGRGVVVPLVGTKKKGEETIKEKKREFYDT